MAAATDSFPIPQSEIPTYEQIPETKYDRKHANLSSSFSLSLSFLSSASLLSHPPIESS